MEYQMLACPHCEGSAKLRVDTIKIGGKAERCAWVYCTKCKARTNYYRRSIYTDYVDQAVVAWNMRTEEWDE